MKTIQKSALLLMFCAIAFLGFGQSFTPSTNLQFTSIDNYTIMMDWTVGTNISHHELEFIFDDVSMGVQTLPGSASIGEYYDPAGTLNQVGTIDVKLTSYGEDEDGYSVAITIKATMTVDDVYNIDKLDQFCQDKHINPQTDGLIFIKTENMHYDLPCICHTMALVQAGTLSPYNTLTQAYNNHQNDGTLFNIVELLQFLGPVMVDDKGVNACQVRFKDDRDHSSLKTDGRTISNENVRDAMYSYDIGDRVVIVNVPEMNNLAQQFLLYDMAGKSYMVNVSAERNQLVIDKSMLSSGLYIVKVITNTDAVLTQKIWIE